MTDSLGWAAAGLVAPAYPTLPARRPRNIQAAALRFWPGHPELSRHQARRRASRLPGPGPGRTLDARRPARTTGKRVMHDSHPVMLERDGELAVVSTAVSAAAAGHGAFVLVAGPAGIGKTTLLRAACTSPAGAGLRILTARGLALERGFPFGIVRQLFEPVRAAAGPGE